ncbi:MAG: DUF2795 domain-containing protein [Candidatus Chisholmbacteria bacterium]|nr:DUF2795 domain-containing protein [Candidatus Chisholmbacteria bacterium]
MQNVKGAMAHLNTHQKFPASKADLVAECDGLSDFSEADKKEFMEKLPEGTYDSPADVAKALNWQMA